MEAASGEKVEKGTGDKYRRQMKNAIAGEKETKI